MAHNDPDRRSFLSTLVGGSLALPLLTTESGHTSVPSPTPPNRPLVVTSKTNAFVREEVTPGTGPWDTGAIRTKTAFTSSTHR